MKCPKCNHENREEAKFCEECGQKLSLICPKCGSELRENARFCDECGTKITSTQPTIPRLEDMYSQLKSLSPDEAIQGYLEDDQNSPENRPVTALFADISGFTTLTRTHSSEEAFQIIHDCFRGLGNIIKKYDGMISNFSGDGFLVLFGVPMHENDAERAILAAMEIRKKMQEYDREVTIGINTALMIIKPKGFGKAIL